MFVWIVGDFSEIAGAAVSLSDIHESRTGCDSAAVLEGVRRTSDCGEIADTGEILTRPCVSLTNETYILRIQSQ